MPEGMFDFPQALSADTAHFRRGCTFEYLALELEKTEVGLVGADS